MLIIDDNNLTKWHRFSIIGYHIQCRPIKVKKGTKPIIDRNKIDAWVIYSGFKWKPEPSPFSSFFEETDALLSASMIYDPRVSELFRVEKENDKKLSEIEHFHLRLLDLDEATKCAINTNCDKIDFEKDETPFIFKKGEEKFDSIAKYFEITDEQILLFSDAYNYKKKYYRESELYIMAIDNIAEIRKAFVDGNTERILSKTTNGKIWDTRKDLIVTGEEVLIAKKAASYSESLFRYINK